MHGILFAVLALVFTAAGPAAALESEFLDPSPTSPEITFIGHGTLMFRQGGKIIHVDPWTEFADYRKLPKADLILITHEHRDHLDLKAIQTVRTPKTVVAASETAARQIRDAVIMRNGETKTLAGFTVEAVPAYNIVHMRSPGVPYHPKGAGNGYIIELGSRRVYIAGDTENTPEMKALKNIDAAFLPMNLPYTMTPEMVADAARAFKPKILYPYHYGNTDVSKLTSLLESEKEIDVRIRKMK
ncbi:MAG TPA: MBL fold metallo-hydrolase [Syntrophales bacterium]|nr:MBL fold metallo-hydrolase [Syntrophales bacterium]HOX94172.1 MBL fold metallo-hydrolase [Syntrophales bacterium]HPI57482.1 MBL fold metallo-hydrolase [Syntrophales bacterium]HPN25661.1 MBL fold metallo-hydrolase [Syntrophales bacterium]HQM29507.1 MBL fold metallo-hydrolase [Syntrophales bacterium]